MAAPSPKPATPEKDVLCAVLEAEDVAVTRVRGRGNFVNSVPLKQFADHLQAAGHPHDFIVDLRECETLDSTFMGVLASISIAQTRKNRPKLIIANANDHVRKLLKTLGLSQLLTVHDAPGGSNDAISKAEESLQPATSQPTSKIDQISHTLEAHKALAQLDDENQIRFQSVIQYLEQSLQNAANGKPDF